MTDVSVKATLSGFSEAKQSVEKLGAAISDLSSEGYSYAQRVENLKKLGEEHAATLRKQQEATNSLKAHTADLVNQFNEQERAQAFANSVIGKGISAMSGYAVAALSVTAIGAAVVKVLHDIDSSGRENAEMSLRLSAALTATGGVVGRTQQQLEGMADAMAKVTRFDDTGIKRAQSIMLTFGNITGEVFERGMKLAADYAERTGGDMSSAARVVGATLSDTSANFGRLAQSIGKIDPASKELIDALHTSGRAYDAQLAKVDALEKKFGGFAETVGGSSVVAVDKFKNSWSDLMKELAKTPGDPTGGKGLFGWYFEGLTRNINAATSSVISFGEFRHQNEIKVLQQIATESKEKYGETQAELVRLNAEGVKAREIASDFARARAVANNQAEVTRLTALLATYFQQHSASQKRLTEITKNEGTNRTKNEADALAKEAEHRKKMDEDALQRQVALDDKLADEWMKKRKAEAEAARRHQKQLTAEQRRAEEERRRNERETFELSVKTRDKTLEDYKDFIDSQLVTARKGSKEEIALMKERAKITEDIFKREDQLRKEKEAQLKEEEKSQKELQEVIKKRALEEIAHLESLNIKNGNLVKMEGDERIRALEALAVQYAAMGDAGVLAYLAIQSEIRKTRTTAEEDFSAMRQVFGRLTFDMVGLFGNVHKSVSSNLADIMKGNQTVADGIKGIFASMVDSIINEFARLAANDILSGIMQLLGVSSGRTGGSLLGSLLGGGQGGGGGGLGGVFKGISKIFGSGSSSGAGGEFADVAMELSPEMFDFANVAGLSDLMSSFGPASIISYLGGPFGAVFGGGKLGGIFGGVGDAIGDALGGIGDIFGFATGGESVVTKPTLFMAGETGAERVRVSPMAGGSNSSGGIVNNFHGPTIMDPYTMRLWLRGQERMLRAAAVGRMG